MKIYQKIIKYNRPAYVFFGKIEVQGDRWPWQKMPGHWSQTEKPGTKYGWGKVSGMARFGGGWDWKLGISKGGSSVIIDLIWGCVRISKHKPEGEKMDSLLSLAFPWWKFWK